MALYKSIKGDDGVTATYHRVLYLTITPNKQNSIGVMSYVDQDIREIEKNSSEANPYHRNTTYELDYDQNMSISEAYEYLKTLPEFADSSDI